MEERPLGPVGLSVPVVGMGTWKTFDVEGAARNARRKLVREALDLDVRLYDTSPMYGAAEEVLGEALRNARDEAIVATKVWAATPDEGRRQIDRALALYGGEVEVYQVHNLRLWREHLAELEARKRDDAIRAIGATHFNPNAFPELEEVMRTGRLDMVQVPYNLADRSVEERILPLAAKLGLGVLVMEPLGTGALARKPPPSDAIASYLDARTPTWAQVCLRWILSDPRVSAVIPATSSPAHLRENVLAGVGPWYAESEREEIAKIFAGS